jgi:hypothetical protein
MEQYNFDSWYNGIVTLIYSEVTYTENDNPIFVTWDNFIESEVIKIKQRQRQIFDKNVSLNLDKFKSEFNKRYSKSLMADEFLEIEKQECFNILFSKIPNKEFVITKNWKIPFNHNELLEIQDYANRTLLSGIDVCLDFVHSPNNKYQVNNKIPSQVYAQLLYDYFKWLQSNFKLENDVTLKNDNLDNPILNKLWFQVGLAFAKGQISKLYEEHLIGTMSSFTQIALSLGNKNYRPFISESYNYRRTSDKNIFSNKKKVEAILKYCKINNIEVSEDFTKRMKSQIY